MVVQYFQKWIRGERMGLCRGGVDGVEGEGRGRVPEGSALWLALSNWLMRKASLCSWQAGDSSSWLRWYTYLGLKWRQWWWCRERLPSHCKGVKKEIRLLHIMPNEIGHRLMHILQCHANMLALPVSSHPIEWCGWVMERLEERWGNSCWKSMFSVSLTLEFEKNTASLAKCNTYKKKREEKWAAQEASVLTNDVAPQRLYSAPGPLQVDFFASFCGMTPRSLSIMEWIPRHWKPSLSCVCCWQMQSEICGTHWEFNAAEFMVLVCAVNKPSLFSSPRA